MTWQVWFDSDECQNALYIITDSFDDAIALARKFDPRYCAGQVVSK